MPTDEQRMRERIATAVAGDIWTQYQNDGTAKDYDMWRDAVAYEAVRLADALISKLEQREQTTCPCRSSEGEAAELRAAVQEWAEATQAFEDAGLAWDNATYAGENVDSYVSAWTSALSHVKDAEANLRRLAEGEEQDG